MGTREEKKNNIGFKQPESEKLKKEKKRKRTKIKD